MRMICFGNASWTSVLYPTSSSCVDDALEFSDKDSTSPSSSGPGRVKGRCTVAQAKVEKHSTTSAASGETSRSKNIALQRGPGGAIIRKTRDALTMYELRHQQIAPG